MPTNAPQHHLDMTPFHGVEGVILGGSHLEPGVRRQHQVLGVNDVLGCDRDSTRDDGTQFPQIPWPMVFEQCRDGCIGEHVSRARRGVAHIPFGDRYDIGGTRAECGKGDELAAQLLQQVSTNLVLLPNYRQGRRNYSRVNREPRIRAVTAILPSG